MAKRTPYEWTETAGKEKVLAAMRALEARRSELAQAQAEERKRAEEALKRGREAFSNIVVPALLDLAEALRGSARAVPRKNGLAHALEITAVSGQRRKAPKAPSCTFTWDDKTKRAVVTWKGVAGAERHARDSTQINEAWVTHEVQAFLDGLRFALG